MTTPEPATPNPRRLTVARCDELLRIYAPWLHAKSTTTRRAAKRAVIGLVDERADAYAREQEKA